MAALMALTARNRMDDFEITIDVKGTTVTVRRWRR